MHSRLGQAGVISKTLLTQSEITFCTTLKINGIGGNTYMLSGQIKENASTKNKASGSYARET